MAIGKSTMSASNKFTDWTFTIPRTRFKIGFSHDIVENFKKEPYLERYILWFGGTVRLHKFWRSDDDRALHDHPWWFITFPLATYHEWREDKNGNSEYVEVKRFRFHFRSATYKHQVVISKPAWTFIISGGHIREWGFWPNGFFIHWKEFLK